MATLGTCFVSGQDKAVKREGWALPLIYSIVGAGPRSAIGRAPDSYTRSGNILSFFLFKKGSCQLLAKVCARSTG